MRLRQGTASDCNKNYKVEKTRKNILNSIRF